MCDNIPRYIEEALTQVFSNIAKNQQGGLSILWAFILPIIVGFTGLGVEAALWYGEKNDLQAATDAATYTTAYYIGTSSSLSTVATNEMTRNGYGSSRNITLTVNNPPTSGAYSGNNRAVEIIASMPQSLFFSKSFLSNVVTIKTRAVALSTPSTSGTACVLGLASAVSGDIISSGTVNLSMPGCVIAANSASSSSIILKGNVSVTAQNFYTAGGIQDTGTVTENTTSQNVTNGSAVPDPFSGLTVPSNTTCTQNNYSAGNGESTISPGVYCGGVTFNSQSDVTLNPGTYVINGGTFKVNGGATVTGTGVTFILTNNATIQWNGGGTISISAPTSGTYSGIVLYSDQNSSGTSNVINGDSNTNLTGVVYIPTGDLQFSGGASSGGSCTKLVANNVSFTGTSSLTNNCPPGSGIPTIPVPNSTGNIALKE